MSRGRRALLLGLLALVLGTLAASDVAGRERRLRDSLGAETTVLVARGDIKPGAPLGGSALAVRRIPRRYAPLQDLTSPDDVAGSKAAVAIPSGTDITAALVSDGAAAAGVDVAPGQRVAEVIADGSPGEIGPGTRVDILVTREDGDGHGSTRLALQDAEVLRASPAAPKDGDDSATPRVSLSLRVDLHDAIYLAAAQSFAKELRVLPRAAGDDGRTARGLTVDSGL